MAGCYSKTSFDSQKRLSATLVICYGERLPFKVAPYHLRGGSVPKLWSVPASSRTRVSAVFKHALDLWEPRLPTMGREAASFTEVRYGSTAALLLGRNVSNSLAAQAVADPIRTIQTELS